MTARAVTGRHAGRAGDHSTASLPVGCARLTWPGWPASGCAPASSGPALSALGIAIGVAAIVAVLGLSSSSQAGLLAEIDRLGTNLLTVTNGQTCPARPPNSPSPRQA